MKRAVLLGATILVGTALGVGACGGAASKDPVALSNGQPEVRINDYRLYKVPGGRTIVCIGFGRADQSGAALSCDWDHPLDK